VKSYTLKEFIAYNNPCFSCGEKISITFTVLDEANGMVENVIRPNVSLNSTQIILKLSYKDPLDIVIENKTNKLTTSNYNKFKKYIETRSIYIISTCERCKTKVFTDDMGFDKNFVKPITLHREILAVYDAGKRYYISTYYEDNKSILIVDDINVIRPVKNAFQLQLPIMPKYKFKDKNHFISKMNTLVNFS
jgi:hypothetical protein